MEILLEEETRSSPMDTCSSSPRERMTARSMKLASSRTFPGHALFVRASMVALGMEVICLPMRRENFDTKKFTSSGIEPKRSRRGGISIGETLERYTNPHHVL